MIKYTFDISSEEDFNSSEEDSYDKESFDNDSFYSCLSGEQFQDEYHSQLEENDKIIVTN